MRPSVKVFDVRGNVPRPMLRYSPASIGGEIFSLSNLRLVFSKTHGPEDLEKKRLEQWKSAVASTKQTRNGSSDQQPPKKPRWQKWYSLASLALLLVAMSLAGLLIFVFNRSLAPVYLGSIRIKSSDSSWQLQHQISAATNGYAVSFKDVQGKVSTYPLKKTGITIDAKASAEQARGLLSEQWLERLRWWQPIRLSLMTKTDKDAFQNFINQAVIKADQPYQNASLVMDGSSVAITPELPGKGQTINYPARTITEVVSELDRTPIQLRKLTIPAPIRAVDLNDEKSRLENILAQKVSFQIDTATVTAKPSDIASWLDLSPVEHDRTIDIAVNSGRVQTYLDKIAKPYVQPPRSRLVMTKADGSQTVLDYGTSGVDIVNKDKTATDIAQKVLAAKGTSQKLDISYAPAKTVEVQPYDKWIVVDVTTKRMYAYEQTNLVQTFLVSAGAPRTPTVLGQYSIYAKYSIQDMRGSNADGSRYYQPDVQWVNYFYKDYAIHGNYWRPISYFGNVNSSHGCVGVVNSDAKWIYDWAPIGTPVIVHQ